MNNLVSGQMLGPYRILEPIGQGGMAMVYKAYHAAMDRYVAVKVLPRQLAENPDFAGRFQQEARTIAKLEHKHILPVYDYGESNGVTYLVMRYLDAGTLKDRMRGHPLALEEIDRLFSDLAEALSYAHLRNVVHRDLKPSNVLLDRHGDVFLTDFGVAKLLEGTAQFTHTGGIIGTPAYMSPEQAQGRPVDQRSDIYSLGIVLFQMLTGRVPFEAETPLAVIIKLLNDPLPAPSSLRPDLPPAFEQVLLKALAKNPEDRFHSVEELLSAWKRAVGEAQARALPPSAKVSAGVPSPASKPASAAAATALPGQPSYTIAAPSRPAPRRRNVGWVLGLFLLGGLTLAAVLFVVAVQFVPRLLAARQGTPVALTTAAPQPTGANPAGTSAPRPRSTSTVETEAPQTETPAVLTDLDLINVSRNPRESEYPLLAMDGQGALHLAWWDSSARPDGDFLHSLLGDEGWEEPDNWTEQRRSPIRGAFQWVLRPDGVLCGLWAEGLEFAERCQESSSSWSQPARLPTSLNFGNEPTFSYDLQGELRNTYVDFQDLKFGQAPVSDGYGAVGDGGRLLFDQADGVHVVWIEQPEGGSGYLLRARYSPDAGRTWNTIETLSDSETQPETPFPGDPYGYGAAMDSAGNLHLAWIAQTEDFETSIYYRRWVVGEGWSAAVKISDSQDAQAMGLALDADDLSHVVWTDTGSLRYSQQKADGRWSEAVIISQDLPAASGISGQPRIVVDQHGVRHIAWRSADDPPEIVYIAFP
ncbi:MAG TPA: protein kinase [Anaerolineales bacterium]|nr:protein kinase [Anaerolineales bacterium]